MVSCLTTDCRNLLPNKQQYCDACCSLKWGAEPVIHGALPKCIMLHITSYCDLLPAFLQCGSSLYHLRLLLGLCASDDDRVKYILRCGGYVLWMQFGEYMMDRFGNNPILTQTDEDYDPMSRLLDRGDHALIKRFPPECLTPLQEDLALFCRNWINDDLCFWYLSRYPIHDIHNKPQLEYFVHVLCGSQSLRCIDMLIQQDAFRNKVSTDRILCSITVLQRAPMCIFRLLWDRHYSMTYNSQRDNILIIAISNINTKVLDLFVHLDGFSAETTMPYWSYYARKSTTLVEWMRQNCQLLRTIWDDDHIWLNARRDMNAFFLEICQTMNIDALTHRLLHQSEKPFMHQIAKHGNWDLFFELLDKYQHLLNDHINWQLAFMYARNTDVRELLCMHR